MFVSKEDQNHQQIAEYSELKNLLSFSSSTSSSTTSMSISPDDYGYFTDSLASTTSSPLHHDTMDLFSVKEYSILSNDSLGDLEHLEPVPSYQDQDLCEFGSKRTKTMYNLSTQDVAIGHDQHDEFFNLECKKSSSTFDDPSSHGLSLGSFSSNQSKQNDIEFKSNHHLNCTQGKLTQLLTRRDSHFEPYVIPGESASIQNQNIKGGIDALVDKSHNGPYISSGESAPSNIDLLDDRDNYFLDLTQDQFPMLASPTRSSINVKVIDEGDRNNDIDNHIPTVSKNNDNVLSMVYPQRKEKISFRNLPSSQDKIILVDNPTSIKDIHQTKQGKWCLYSYCFIYAQ